MKKIICLLFLISLKISYSQNIKLNDIEIKILKIDKLQQQSKLEILGIDDMKTCGGNLIGYYYFNKLVLLISQNGGETGTITNKYYIDNNKIIKIENLEDYTFINNNSNTHKPKTKNIIEKKEFYFTPEIFIVKNFKKEKIITYSDDQIITCGKNMIKLLNERKATN
ncbi:hypothetical protein [Flavobacterium sp. ZB4P13]|uniref:hypothetical protein n=1 Tax=Flavobacterium sp. ZB4P13 TaxID=3401728 RepID=UPI003AAF8174